MSDIIVIEGHRVSNLIGKKFGRLTVIKFHEIRSGQSIWLCQCECGKQKPIIGKSLTTGSTKSCRCLANELTSKRKTTHGKATGRRDPVYRVWCSMIDRCTRAKSQDYADYGGRGIKVCDRWRNSFQAFYSDMGPRPGENYSIGRIDNNGDYEPGNVRWETPIQQAQNTRRSHIITANGKSMTMIQWSRETGIGRSCIERRIRRGWPTDKAVSIPPRPMRRSKETINES